MAVRNGVVALLALACCTLAASPVLTVENMKVQNLAEATIEPGTAPTFSWVPVAAKRGDAPSAFRVLIRVARGDLGGGASTESCVFVSAPPIASKIFRTFPIMYLSHGPVFDSGKLSSTGYSYTYTGALRPATKYEWAVQWWAAAAEPSALAWSTFTTGLGDWGNSSWIGAHARAPR